MVNLAEIHIWNKLVGYVTWNPNRGIASFEYDTQFVNDGLQLSPIQMPLRKGTVYEFPNLRNDTFLGLPGLLSDSLPDAYGKALLNQWLALSGRIEGEANPVERLCYQGNRSMGALEFRPAHDTILEQTSSIEIDELVRVAAMAINQKQNLHTELNDDVKRAILNIIRVGTSAGGQRAKAVIAINDKTGEVLSGQLDAPQGFEHWLIKLDGVSQGELGDPSEFGRVEYCYHLMAKTAGIDMTECRLLVENNRAHFLTKRFDRIGHNKKIHMQTLCGIAHYDYQAAGLTSYEQACMVLRRLKLSYYEILQLYRRAVFNVVARNQDDHTKNISFLMNEKGQWQLSPAYDVAWAYNPAGQWTNQHQMSINFKRDNFVRQDLIALASVAEIDQHSANQIINDVIDVVAAWPSIATAEGISRNVVEAIGATHRLTL